METQLKNLIKAAKEYKEYQITENWSNLNIAIEKAEKVLKEPIVLVYMLTCKKCLKGTYKTINCLCQECYDQLTK